MAISYELLPEHIREGMKLYVEQGVPPGGFCQAALANELVEAFRRADDVNTECMGDIAAWLYTQCPRAARGSREAVDAWIERGGLATNKAA